VASRVIFAAANADWLTGDPFEHISGHILEENISTTEGIAVHQTCSVFSSMISNIVPIGIRLK